VIFNERSKFVGTHAFLSASNYHWINYDLERLRSKYRTARAAQEGVEKHELAHMLIRHKQKLPEERRTLNLYVNDAIDFGMTPEQLVFYSANAYGTADTISFDEDEGFLRIHDYKSGVIRASVHQLEIYAAYFCLEYAVRPFEIKTELRIYQNDKIDAYVADPDTLSRIMDKVETFDQYIEEWKTEGPA
jgi:hypothetical protein